MYEVQQWTEYTLHPGCAYTLAHQLSTVCVSQALHANPTAVAVYVCISCGIQPTRASQHRQFSACQPDSADKVTYVV